MNPSTPDASRALLRDVSTYPWQSDRMLDVPPATEALSERIAPPPGFTRIALEPASFASFLRDLPLTAPDTPVRSFRGQVLYRANDERIAAVVALDVGRADLQQCADAIIRLHAEWLWSKGRRDMSYAAASGVWLPFQRWARGERPISDGQNLRWRPRANANPDDHASFRKYLDSVFTFANSVSLARQALAIEPEELRPGDFFVLPGNPGHAVIVVDLARSQNGHDVALLAQSYMPAQNLHVLRSSTGVWFALDRTAAVHTPFWRPFPWTALRRLAE